MDKIPVSHEVHEDVLAWLAAGGEQGARRLHNQT